MRFRLVDCGWDKEIAAALSSAHDELRIICPFIKHRALEVLIGSWKPRLVQVVTRFNLGEFHLGVNDIRALELVMALKGQVRGVKNLHAKLYLFGNRCAIATSANLTQAGMARNCEFGFVTEDTGLVNECRSYFENLWARSGPNLTVSRVVGWQQQLDRILRSGSRRELLNGLIDEGVDIGLPPPEGVTVNPVVEAMQGFVKFFGTKDRRSLRSNLVLAEVDGGGAHWACSYPRRPRQVEDGAVMYLARLVKDPNDTLIFGRAIASKHVDGRDDATEEDLKRRPWKKDWPYYIRLRNAEFLAGSLANGISLRGMMSKLGPVIFASTSRHQSGGRGNVDPRLALRQQPSVELARKGLELTTALFDAAIQRYGKLPLSELEKLDWPKVLDSGES